MDPASSVSSCDIEKARGLKRSRSALFNEAQTPKLSEVAIRSFHGSEDQKQVTSSGSRQINVVELDALSTVNLEDLLGLFQEYRQKDNIDLEEDVSKLISQKVTVENFKSIVAFLKRQFQQDKSRTINKTLLLGLAHFAGYTIADNKLYLLTRRTLAKSPNRLSILEFFKKDKELFPNLILTLSFGMKPRNLGLNFVPFFNNSFSGIVKKLVINTDASLFPAILNQLTLCPKLKAIDLKIRTGYLANDFSSNIDLVAELIKQRLMNFKEVSSKFPNLSVVEIDISINFQNVAPQEEDNLMKDIQSNIDNYFSKKPLELPFPINTVSIYACSYR